MPCDDCSRAEICPPCVNEPECWCGHPEERHTTSLPEEGREDYCTECDGKDEKHSFVAAEAAPPPPQPERRPPRLIAYSVQGHLYEVALPGDATVVAQDGALIITHALGPVAGIVQAGPLEGEQS